MAETLEQAVRDAAAFLDEHWPGWHERVDLKILDIEDPCNCVLGQAWTSFGLAVFDLEEKLGGDLVEFFACRDTHAFFGSDPTEHWRKEILRRRTLAPAQVVELELA